MVATVLTAGLLGAAAGAAFTGLGGLLNLGTTILAGGSSLGLGATMATGFTAGFVGSVAGQGLGCALKLQEHIDFKGALITGLAAASTAGAGHMLKNVTMVKNFYGNLAKHNYDYFNFATATQMMDKTQ